MRVFRCVCSDVCVQMCVFVSSLSFALSQMHLCESFPQKLNVTVEALIYFQRALFISSSLFIYLFIFSADAECVERRSCQSSQPGLGGRPNMGEGAGCCGGRMEIEDSCLFLCDVFADGGQESIQWRTAWNSFLSVKQQWRRTKTFWFCSKSSGSVSVDSTLSEDLLLMQTDSTSIFRAVVTTQRLA